MQLNLDAPVNLVPYAENWFGVWAMEETALRSIEQQLSRISLTTHLATDALAVASADGPEYEMTADGLAIIDMCGVMMKQRQSMGLGCSTVETRRQLSLAKRNPQVKGAVLRIESPGGTAAGTMELAEAVAQFGKPTLAYCNDITASAAYWVASQCDEIVANTMAQVGSIGTYSVVADMSGYAAKEGIKVHVVRAGEFKGMGTPGTEVTQKQLDEMQRLIDAINSHFLQGVARGRQLSAEQVESRADGRVHIAAEAKSLNLIDSVETWEQAVERFAAQVNQKSRPTAAAMIVTEELAAMAETTTPQPVTAAELKDRFPKASAEWRLNCLEKGYDLAQCVEAYASLMEAQAEAAEQRAKAAEARASKPGADPVSFSAKSKSAKAEDDDDDEDMEEGDDAKSAWDTAVTSCLKRCNGDRMKATTMANRQNPGLREAMLEQVNAARRVRR